MYLFVSFQMATYSTLHGYHWRWTVLWTSNVTHLIVKIVHYEWFLVFIRWSLFLASYLLFWTFSDAYFTDNVVFLWTEGDPLQVSNRRESQALQGFTLTDYSADYCSTKTIARKKLIFPQLIDTFDFGNIHCSRVLLFKCSFLI